MDLPAPTEPTPKGKRSVRRSRYGNLNGYVAGRFWHTFGDAFAPWVQREADAWLAGAEIGEEP